jgi:hypothetical protein
MAKVVEDLDVATVALAALTKMVSLLASELVVGKHNDDFDVLEAAMRAKLFAAVEDVSPDATAQGISLAHRLINPVLKELRQRVETRAAASSHIAEDIGVDTKQLAHLRKLN